MTKLEDLYPYMVSDLRACDKPLVVQRLQRVFVEFCRQTEVYTHKAEDIDVVADQRDYPIPVPTATYVKIISDVWLQGAKVDRRYYQLKDQAVLRWEEGYAPKSAITSGLDIEVVLVPQLEIEIIDPVFLERWYEGIIAGALAELLLEQGKPWFDPVKAEREARKYARARRDAIVDRTRKKKGGPLTARAPHLDTAHIRPTAFGEVVSNG